MLIQSSLKLVGRTDLSTVDNQVASFLMVVYTDAVYLNLQSKTFPKPVTAFSEIDGIGLLFASETCPALFTTSGPCTWIWFEANSSPGNKLN